MRETSRLSTRSRTHALASASSFAAGTPSTAAVRATCAQVSAVLSDGPAPDSDPVGYAEAQILPLGQIHTSDAQLRAAIGKLASAYRTFFDSNGGSDSAKLAVAAASRTTSNAGRTTAARIVELHRDRLIARILRMAGTKQPANRRREGKGLSPNDRGCQHTERTCSATRRDRGARRGIHALRGDRNPPVRVLLIQKPEFSARSEVGR